MQTLKRLFVPRRHYQGFSPVAVFGNLTISILLDTCFYKGELGGLHNAVKVLYLVADKLKQANLMTVNRLENLSFSAGQRPDRRIRDDLDHEPSVRLAGEQVADNVRELIQEGLGTLETLLVPTNPIHAAAAQILAQESVLADTDTSPNL